MVNGKWDNRRAHALLFPVPIPVVSLACLALLAVQLLVWTSFVSFVSFVSRLFLAVLAANYSPLVPALTAWVDASQISE